VIGDEGDAVSESKGPAPEPAPSTEVVQTIQRRTWIRWIVILLAAMIVLVAVGWVVGTASASASEVGSVAALVLLRG